MKKNTFYDTYIQHLKDKLYKDLFKTTLPKLKKSLLKESPEEILDHAMEYYKKHNQIKAKKYIINKVSNIQYIAKNEEGKSVEIAKGNFYLKHKPQIVNFYQISTKLPNTSVIKNYRFGTPVHSFKDISKIVEDIEEFLPTKKNLIVFSLLSPCNNKICKSFSNIAKKGSEVSNLLKKGFSATTEDKIIQKELKASGKIFGKKRLHYNTILFPLSSKKYTGVGSQLIMTDVDVFHYDKEAYKKKIKDPKVKKIYDLIQLDNDPSGKLAFESIIRIACYFFHFLRKEYILAYHCKSGKDRTSIFDAIQQATYYYINQHKEIQSPGDLTSMDFEEIRHLAQKMLMYGLIIAFYSNGAVGLKLKNIPVAKYIFYDNEELYHRFIGHSSIVSS